MKQKIYRIVAVFLAINILTDAIFPTLMLALTGGPTQPEVQGFTPIGTSEMVNAFSGDFNYNIPLMDVGGYPLNLSYQSGITTDQEASWVGLGWSLNPGVINRSMRSLPDDFSGDEVKKEFNIKPNLTFGIKGSIPLELMGVKVPPGKNVSVGGGMTYNNYTGYAFSVSLDLKTSSGESGKPSAVAGLGLTAGTDAGVGITPSLSFSKNVSTRQQRDRDVTSTLGLSYNSRGGLEALTLSTQVDRKGRITVADPRGTSSSNKSRSLNDGSSISFASQTYLPSSDHSMLNLNLSLGVTLGGAIFGAHANAKFEGFFAGQYLQTYESESFPAYGYIYSQNSLSQDNVLLDFNREKDGAYNEDLPCLPLSNFTYDIYGVSGQGIGGTYRAHRGDIGILHDGKTTNISAGANFPGIEIGAGNTAHPGLNVSLNESNSRTGKWEDNNDAAQLLGFQATTNDPFYEAAYFKKAGEKNAESDMDFFNDMGGFEPVRININHNLESAPTQGNYNAAGTNMSRSYRQARARRSEVISLQTAIEAKEYGEIKDIEDYPTNTFDVNAPETYKNIFQPGTIRRTDAYRQDHHTSQITTYRSDGAKYVYGIPAYNITQDERTFAIEEKSFPDKAKGLTDYVYGMDDTRYNAKGLDHYFDKTVLPAYAHSYLLTEVLSADYVDLTGNGPTDDDLGTYTKINYSQTTPDYKWRVPYNKANYNEGLRSRPADLAGDDKGSFVYGEKEIWYMHSIETKNYVAEFTVSPRVDGFGATDEETGWSHNGSAPMQKLTSITLYSKQDLIACKRSEGTTHPMEPTPIKTVHFEYDYFLCKGVDNNTLNIATASAQDKRDPDVDENLGGKLTLRKIYFTYGKSMKGKLSPYEFDYDSYNPGYNIKAYDRWGNYKENTDDHPTAEFPYTDQSKTIADRNASAWHMTGVNLPSGGVINVVYESDDYAYVQNKRAMEMCKIIGSCPHVPGNLGDLTNELYKKVLDLPGGGNSYDYMAFELSDQSITDQTIGKACFQEKDGTEIENLYFKFLVNLAREHGHAAMEYVRGYAEIQNHNYGVFTDGTTKYGWVQIKPITIRDKPDRPPVVSPISQEGWNFTRMNLPELASGKGPITKLGGLLQVVKAMAGTFKSIMAFLEGYYNQMRIDGMARTFEPSSSCIRLYNPSNAKKGGGCRVKDVVLSDNWSGLTGDSKHEDSHYGQHYDYTTTDEYGQKISSGVAAYEPLLGGDENPFRQPVPYKIRHKYAASDEYYQETPYGESFFPGANVGYSKVTVTNIVPAGVTVTKHATGSVVNEFYTAKDFPTITKQTTTDANRFRPNPLLKLLKIRAVDFMTASQGFCVELNDMHGKPKETSVYQEGKDKPISGVKYLYKGSVQPVSTPSYVDEPIRVGSLDNNILVMEKNGSISEKMVGVDYDFITDMRENKTTTRTAGLGGNLEAFLVLAFPAIVPTVLPSYSQERVRFRSAVTTKIINRYGILEETIAYDVDSKISTKNKMLDAETGEVLLTETQNQYNDPVYSFTYPAHLEYEGMGPAYKNIGVTVAANVSNPSRYFVPGDELKIFKLEPYTLYPKAWVKTVTPTTFVAIDRDGLPVDLTGMFVTVLRSGRRNQASVSIGSVVSENNPLQEKDGEMVLDINSTIGVLNAGSVEYSDKNKVFCECAIHEGQLYNPYVLGMQGNWHAIKPYALLSGRTQSHMNDNTNVREDGTYSSFSPFWTKPADPRSNDPWQKSVEHWQGLSEVTLYSPYGMELENKDALGIYSSAIYGYNNSQPIAVAANAKYQSIAFDGFEDYDFNSCKDDHFSYKSITPTNDKLDRTKSHTGKNSIKVGANSEIKIKKTLIKCQ